MPLLVRKLRAPPWHGIQGPSGADPNSPFRGHFCHFPPHHPCLTVCQMHLALCSCLLISWEAPPLPLHPRNSTLPSTSATNTTFLPCIQVHFQHLLCDTFLVSCGAAPALTSTTEHMYWVYST